MNSKLIFKYSIKNVERELEDDEMQFWDIKFIKPSTCSPLSGEISLCNSISFQHEIEAGDSSIFLQRNRPN